MPRSESHHSEIRLRVTKPASKFISRLSLWIHGEASYQLLVQGGRLVRADADVL